MMVISILLSLILRAVCRAPFRGCARILAGSSSKLCQNRGILLFQVFSCVCRFPEFQEMFGCHQDHPTPVHNWCSRLGNAREGAAAPDFWNRLFKEKCLFPTDRGGSWQGVLGQEEICETAGKGQSATTSKAPKIPAEGEQGNSAPEFPKRSLCP